MTSFKLILKNVKRNIRDYLIYFLTLMLSVSLFYAFNSISDQPAFSEMGMTRTLLYEQLGILLSALSVLVAIVLAFLIIYANQFLLKRRKKSWHLYDAGDEKRTHFPYVCRRNNVCWIYSIDNRINFWFCAFTRIIFGRFETVCY